MRPALKTAAFNKTQAEMV